MKIKREHKLSNLDLFAGYTAYIKEVKEVKITTAKNKTEEEYVVEFKELPSCSGQRINIII